MMLAEDALHTTHYCLPLPETRHQTDTATQSRRISSLFTASALANQAWEVGRQEWAEGRTDRRGGERCLCFPSTRIGVLCNGRA